MVSIMNILQKIKRWLGLFHPMGFKHKKAITGGVIKFGNKTVNDINWSKEYLDKLNRFKGFRVIACSEDGKDE